MFSLHRDAALAAALGTVLALAAAAGVRAAGETAGPSLLADRASQEGKTSPGITVQGTLATRDSRRLISGSVGLYPLGPGEAASVAVEDADIRQDGGFTFRNVPPGRYQLRARAEVQGARLAHFSTLQILVEGRDLAQLDLVLLPGAAIAGRLTIASRGTPAPLFAEMRVQALSIDGNTVLDQVVAPVKKDGSYRLPGVIPGTHWLLIEELADPWVVKSIVHRGREVTDTGLDVTSGQEISDVLVSLTDTATEISGVVRDPAGGPAGGAMVFALPMGEHLWTLASRRLGRARSDRNGRYRLRGLPAGEYRLAAIAEDPGAPMIYPRERLRELFAAGSPVHLQALETRTLDLALTAAPASR